MRITNGMMQNTSLNALYGNANKLNTLYNQMGTLKKISKPSDDPIIAGRSLKLKINLLEVSQHQTNVKEATSWMDVTETALSNMQEILKDIRTRCTQAANDTLTTEDRQKIQDDITQLYEQLKQEANATYTGRQIFSGFKTDQPLFIDDPANPGNTILNSNIIDTTTTPPTSFIDGQDINYEIGVGNTLNVNTLGVDKLMFQIGTDIQGLVTSLADPNSDLNEVFTNALSSFDSSLSDVSSKISDLGSRQLRLEYTDSRLTDDKTNFTELLSKTEDVDLEEVYVEFNSQYMIYQSALQATSKLIRNTLADYLS